MRAFAQRRRSAVCLGGECGVTAVRRYFGLAPREACPAHGGVTRPTTAGFPARIVGPVTDRAGVLSFPRSGQSLIESCMVIAILCLVLFGGLQVSQLYMTAEVLDHAALCGARARAVGFNDFMVDKTIRVAAIPVAGRLTQPTYTSNPYAIIPTTANKIGGAWTVALTNMPNSAQVQIEQEAIPLYLAAVNPGQLPGILNYELDYLDQWGQTKQTVDFAGVVTRSITVSGDLVEVRVDHRFPLNFPFHQAFFDGDVDPMEGKATVDNHYPLYLE